MQILLDTHTFLWIIDDSQRLPESFRGALDSGEHEVFLSVVSLWEIAIKVAAGKLVIPVRDIQNLARLAEERATRLLAIRPKHLDHLKTLPVHHRDPFDRLILCQAITENMLLASVDTTMRRYDVQMLPQ